MSGHGHTSKSADGKVTVSTTYRAWQKMKLRSKRPACHGYSERWEQFTGFLEDMGERPDGMVLVRADERMPYSKDNCAWKLARTGPREGGSRKAKALRKAATRVSTDPSWDKRREDMEAAMAADSPPPPRWLVHDGPPWPWDVWETLTPSERMAWKIELRAVAQKNMQLATEMLRIISRQGGIRGGSGNADHLGFLGFIFYWEMRAESEGPQVLDVLSRLAVRLSAAELDV